ncbi:MAG: nucleotidyl transferase AbiEii/AbiGii toxin family protein [Thermodesulfobacteriota bacterium]
MQDLKNLKCLLPETGKLLTEFIDTAEFLNKYVLAGGSGLALYLCHRKSEDLDFFTYENSFEKEEVFKYLKRFKHKEIINETSEQLDILINGVKVTFFNSAWDFLRPDNITRFNLATLDNITAMKVHTLFLRATYRDYYDLYYIAKEKKSLKDIYDCSKEILEGINFKLFASALVYIDDIKDDNINHLEPAKQLSKQDIRSFFEKELSKL